jgi:hypothetical protein
MIAFWWATSVAVDSSHERVNEATTRSSQVTVDGVKIVDLRFCRKFEAVEDEFRRQIRRKKRACSMKTRPSAPEQ